MKYGYQFTNQCGTVYQCGNLVFTPDGNSLLSPVGNRISVFDLAEHTVTTLPFENRKEIARIVLSHNGKLLLSVDEEGRSLLINFKRRVVLHRFNFKEPVLDVQFSPDDEYIAITNGKRMQVWRAPSSRREFAPFVLHRVYTGHYDDVTCIAWSADSQYIATGSKDNTVRIYSLHPLPDYVPVTLTGHRDTVLGVYFGEDDTLYSVSKDAAAFVWAWQESTKLNAEVETDETGEVNATIVAPRKSREHHAVPQPSADGKSLSVLRGEWRIQHRHFFQQDHAHVCSVSYEASRKLLVVGFETGIFGLYEMPDCNKIHTLSISQQRIQTVAINPSGEWLAFGCAQLGQLLVWEWQSETYVLKQQGHFYTLNALTFSADGSMIVTGGDDGKIKVWNANSGFCFVTFKDHTGPINGLEFIGAGNSVSNALVSCSSDGTVRAFDLVRYRNFRTMTTPTPCQFMCVACDASGDIVAAGAREPFDVYIWAVKTGKLVDVLSGHEGPVVGLAFNPTSTQLASSSWDNTIKLWDVYKAGGSTETLNHTSDVLAIAFRPDGKELCCSTRDGKLHFWNLQHSVLVRTIDCTRDAIGGRKAGDARSARNSEASKHFTTVVYSADGECVLAGGRTKFVCIYAVESRMLLTKFQLSHNRSLAGVVEKLSTKKLTPDGHDIDTLDVSDSDDEKTPDESLPGVTRGNFSKRSTRQEIRTTCVRFSPTGRLWAAATTQGLQMYSLDDNLTFDPFELDEDVTPDRIAAALERGQHVRALIMALHLNEAALLNKVVEEVPLGGIALAVRSVPLSFLQRLITLIAANIDTTPHLEFYLQWALVLMQTHGRLIREKLPSFAGTLRGLQKSISTHQSALAKICTSNDYTLRFLSSVDVAPAAGAAAGSATEDGDSGDEEMDQ